MGKDREGKQVKKKGLKKLIETADMGRDCLLKLAAETEYEHFTLIIDALMMIENILYFFDCL